MMWPIVGELVESARFESFMPLHVLNDYDGPRIFTLRDADGALCLACWSDEDATHSRYLVVPVTSQIVADLENGVIPVHEALAHPHAWVVDVQHNGAVDAVWLVAQRDIPADAQPQPRTFLHRVQPPTPSTNGPSNPVTRRKSG